MAGFLSRLVTKICRVLTTRKTVDDEEVAPRRNEVRTFKVPDQYLFTRTMDDEDAPAVPNFQVPDEVEPEDVVDRAEMTTLETRIGSLIQHNTITRDPAFKDSPSVSQGTTYKAVVQPDLTNLPEKSGKDLAFSIERLAGNRMAIHGANGKIDEISGIGANSCWINIIKEVRRLEEKGINLLLFMKKKLGNGLSTLFWDDVWCDGGKLKNRFPRAYALENSKQITVGQKLAHPSLYHSFRRHPRGGLELTQVEELAKVINPVVLTQSPDSWSWTLNNSGGYTVASSRNMIDSRLLPKGDLKTRWIRYVPNKVNTFAWKVMTNSLPTRFNISRRGIDIESLSCVNCDVGIETNDHLFFACNTAKKISKLINRWWDVPFMDINSYGEWRSWIDNVKLPKKNKSMFQVLITGVGIDAILCLAGTIADHMEGSRRCLGSLDLSDKEESEY
ncbi:RNA-directed DNA polymerase, eukaryota, reverse transcriptase zinc-binding domain protein [Tanacetum coccineum]